MKNFDAAKKAYVDDHLSKDYLKQSERRLNSLKAIENVLTTKSPELLKGNNLFKNFSKDSFARQYMAWKGSALSGAEKSVITGLFKFSK